MRVLGAPLLLAALCGCSVLLGSATSRLAADLSAAVLNQPDVETVRDGAPAYLLLLDGLIEGDPDNGTLLLAGARLYGSYAAAFVEDAARARRLAARAHEYGTRALCLRNTRLCGAAGGAFDAFAALLSEAGPSDVALLYGFGAAWAGWIQSNSDDWSAIADVPKLEALMRRVVELDEAHEGGGAHAYLGVLSTQLPASLGGKPELGRRHFERAIALSRDRDLMVKVLYARWYARLTFDRPLHDRLLQEVLEADADAPGLILSNALAQAEARALLDSADDYF